MSKADILCDCIKNEMDCLPDDDHIRVSKMLEDLSDLAEPNSILLRTYERALEKVLEGSEIGLVTKSHLNYIEWLLDL